MTTSVYNDCMKIEHKLSESGIMASVYSTNFNGLPAVAVEICWGDWKHDHARAQYIIRNMGFCLLDSEVTEENGSDCYSAIHTFADI